MSFYGWHELRWKSRRDFVQEEFEMDVELRPSVGSTTRDQPRNDVNQQNRSHEADNYLSRPRGRPKASGIFIGPIRAHQTPILNTQLLPRLLYSAFEFPMPAAQINNSTRVSSVSYPSLRRRSSGTYSSSSWIRKVRSLSSSSHH